ncbi:uncharacterized protein NECHADRAFT_85576 [Fusarium vanettenii 77-13-4]|uniref:F-box domain-containing protein n=1 Tax=Fusarium vanettenii (strain ATCC MYA-4622 / CBS 123669 / FGSC 9596 / NRRL 45880 / 77-13-4) TaxID=660122 RepID=C7ZNX5_FUSV7|nr:uncharacterized protein NECHADRAFT_85576 [Fusarium vanettenii 77-13-4]EEU34274.1 hypothetical protein NECHADRAFT_85576 [Fusarium vanettenii 77-13-4]
MEQLAPEILSSIALCLWEDSEESLAPFATLSRQWQPYIEAQTFRRLFLNPTRLSEAISQSILTPTRLSCLRYLRCEFIFPAHETDSTNPDDADDEIVFVKIVTQLFSLLSKTPPCKDPLVYLCLEIPVPGVFGSSEQYASDYGEPVDYPFVAQGQVRTSYLDFPPGYEEELPELPMVYKMSTNLISRSVVFSPRSICLIASKMPRLRKVNWELSDAEKLDTGLAGTLKRLPMSIEMFHLTYVRELPNNHSFQPPSIIPPDSQQDPLSEALCEFTQRIGLKDFTFSGSVDHTIFWPSSESSDEQPYWPSLKSIDVYPHEVLPSGEWLTMQRPGSRLPPSVMIHLAADIPGEGLERRFRDYPVYSLMDPFFRNMGKCVARMPKVEYCSISFSDAWLSNLHFCTEFPEIPCLVLAGKPEPEVGKETSDIWREAVKVHNKDFRLHFNADDPFSLKHFSGVYEEMDVGENSV